MRIREIAQVRVRCGYHKIRVLLNREGWQVSKYLVERIYREEGLTLHNGGSLRRGVAEHRRERFHPTAQSSVVDGLCSGSACGWKKVPIADGGRYLHSGMPDHQIGAGIEGRRCSDGAEPNQDPTRSSEVYLL